MFSPLDRRALSRPFFLFLFIFPPLFFFFVNTFFFFLFVRTCTSLHLLLVDFRSFTIFSFIADKQFNAPNFNLVNREDLNRIPQFEIFLHKDGQLPVAHVILGYTPISSSFQSLKHVIKAKDPWLL